MLYGQNPAYYSMPSSLSNNIYYCYDVVLRCVYQKCRDQETCSGYSGRNIFLDAAGSPDDAHIMDSEDEGYLVHALNEFEAEKREHELDEILMSQDDLVLLQALNQCQSVFDNEIN